MIRSTRLKSFVSIWTLGVLAGLGGCDALKTDEYRFLDPTAVVRRPERSTINPILQTVNMADQSQDMPPNAALPQEEDYVYTNRDYEMGPTDIVDIGVLDLFQQGLESVLRREVSTGGTIDLPLLSKLILAQGKTKDELKDDIMNAYRNDGILKEPVVSVTVVLRHQNVFSVLGSIQRPGTYSIVRKDMRLLEAMAAAGGLSQTNLKYLYVIRPAPATLRESGKSEVYSPSGPPALPALPEIPGEARPSATTKATVIEPNRPSAPVVPTPASKPATGGTDVDKVLNEWSKVLPGPAPATRPASAPAPSLTPSPAPPAVPRMTEVAAGPAAAPAPVEARGSGRWIYTGGRWVQVQSSTSQPASVVAQSQPGVIDPWGWSKLSRSNMARIIAINLTQLQNGDPRMNILVRDNDIIQVPLPDSGEFYIMGEVSRPGVYSLTNRKITVKMALAAAGNLGPMAWPENAMLIRRVGDSEELMIPLNVEAIARGDEPDLFLKADDVLAVGTHVASTFMLVVKNAFRLTYGFGFIYDRNFSDPYTTTLDSKRFTRW